MTDSFGRVITYLRVSVTELCNLRCQYCMPAEGVRKRSHADMLTEEELLRAVRIAAPRGVPMVGVTGGGARVERRGLSRAISSRSAAASRTFPACRSFA